MANAAKSDPGPSPDLETIQGDIAILKRDLATLMSHLKIGAKEAAGQLGDEAKRIDETLAAQGERSAKAIGRHLEKQPVMWLLVAVAVGFIGGRVLSR